MSHSKITKFPTLALLNWYEKNKRDLPWRKTKDPYKVWLSEVMLQQTQVKTMIPYYQRWLERLPTIQDLAAASEQEVLKLWEGLGYYNRCHNFQKAAKRVCAEYDGRVPDHPDLFLKLPGVGPYILSAVMSIAFKRALPVVDGNVLRVVTRYIELWDDISKSATKNNVYQMLLDLIPKNNPGDFNQAVMELGALVCAPKNPTCSTCPLKRACQAKKKESIDSLPFRPRKKKIPLYKVALAVILKKNKFLIQKRPANGHLAGMWEFPGGKIKADESAEQAITRECHEELDVSIKIIGKLKNVKHAYTHFKIELNIFICRLTSSTPQARQSQPIRWIGLNEMTQYPFPAANYKFFKELEAVLVKEV
ncbi:MAG: A/G-specific adenine glycosylase [Thermodesulfobacteriota bacterium]|nr:A/G-specific adenine glycosylase [Thermodesulfobacteriota bacterium]